MGYTHYFSQMRDVTEAEWKALAEASEQLLKASGIPVADGMGDDDTDPEITDDRIWFNGVGDDSHETMVLTRVKEAKQDYVTQAEYDSEGAFGFCKTAYKPYDTCVTAVLIAAQYFAPGAWDVSSDGDAPDWEDGLDLVESVLGDHATANYLGKA